MQTRSADIILSPGVPGRVRAIHSLLERHVSVLACELLPLQSTWSLVRHEGYDGNLTVLIASDGDVEPSLVFSRSAAGFHLGVLHADNYQEVGCYSTIEALVAAARGRLPLECGLSHAS
jgi:hypothetical protein